MALRYLLLWHHCGHGDTLSAADGFTTAYFLAVMLGMGSDDARVDPVDSRH